MTYRFKRLVRRTSVLCFILVCWFAISESSFQDAVEEEKYYRQMVCSGHWPDFHNLDVICP